jgi:hypothetical protein
MLKWKVQIRNHVVGYYMVIFLVEITTDSGGKQKFKPTQFYSKCFERGSFEKEISSFSSSLRAACEAALKDKQDAFFPIGSGEGGEIMGQASLDVA